MKKALLVIRNITILMVALPLAGLVHIIVFRSF